MLRKASGCQLLEEARALDAQITTASDHQLKSSEIHELHNQRQEITQQILQTVVPLAETYHGFEHTDLQSDTITWLKSVGGYGTANQLLSPLFTPAALALGNPPTSIRTDIERYMRSSYAKLCIQSDW